MGEVMPYFLHLRILLKANLKPEIHTEKDSEIHRNTYN